MSTLTLFLKHLCGVMFPHCFVNRYVDNICKNPTEEKYRKIKLSNKVFQVCLHYGPQILVTLISWHLL